METALTKKLKKEIYRATTKQGVFGCFEVTIGWFGKERVDYMTYNTNDIFRCYEVKVSESDFKSSCANSFVGHYNYYVMPNELYAKVCDSIPDFVGVYDGGTCLKRAKRITPAVDTKILMQSILRSLSREADYVYKNNDKLAINREKREKGYYRSQAKKNENDYNSLLLYIYEIFGTDWQNDYEDWHESMKNGEFKQRKEEMQKKVSKKNCEARRNGDKSDERYNLTTRFK